MIIKARNRDTAWFSMLDSEWPKRKAAFECWLDPSNFDANARQKVSLSTLNQNSPSRQTSSHLNKPEPIQHRGRIVRSDRHVMRTAAI